MKVSYNIGNFEDYSLQYNFEYSDGSLKFTGYDLKKPEHLLILEDYGDVKQGSVVELVEKKSHYSLCVTTEGELWIRNEVLDTYYAPGEEVWVDITTKWDGNFYHAIGKFIHHDGPRMGLVSLEGGPMEVFLDQLCRCNLKD